MILSKPLSKALEFYFTQLYVNPIKTKAITCCVIAASGNLASQYISGVKAVNRQNLLAFAAFGLLFGGTIPHFFYGWLERAISEDASFAVLKKLLIERLIYSPLNTAFTLYTISRLEGKDHKTALKDVEGLYWVVLTSSWKYLTILQLLNLSIVPPVLRVLIVNLIGFFWTIYIANKRRQQSLKGGQK